MEKKRCKYLDCLRGLAVLWVVIHHISLNYGVIKYGVCGEGITIFKLFSFFMVPFYIISGYFFNVKNVYNCMLLIKQKNF